MTIDLSRIMNFRAGATNLIAALCEELGLEEIVNKAVTWDEKQCFLSPGALAKALLINMLDDRRALYRVEEYYQKRDTRGSVWRGRLALPS